MYAKVYARITYNSRPYHKQYRHASSMEIERQKHGKSKRIGRMAGREAVASAMIPIQDMHKG